MKKLLFFVALAASAFASAQGISEPTNIAFRFGFGYPLDNLTRDITGDMIGFGADVFFEKSLLKNGETTLSVDWLGRGFNGDKGNIFPITLTQRWYTGGSLDDANRTYYLIGAGVAIVDIVSTNTVAAGRFGLGVELSNQLFGEIDLFYTDASSGARGTAVGIYLGYRF